MGGIKITPETSVRNCLDFFPNSPSQGTWSQDREWLCFCPVWHLEPHGKTWQLDTGTCECDRVQLFASLSGIVSHHPVASTAGPKLSSTYYYSLICHCSWSIKASVNLTWKFLGSERRFFRGDQASVLWMIVGALSISGLGVSAEHKGSKHLLRRDSGRPQQIRNVLVWEGLVMACD